MLVSRPYPSSPFVKGDREGFLTLPRHSGAGRNLPSASWQAEPVTQRNSIEPLVQDYVDHRRQIEAWAEGQV